MQKEIFFDRNYYLELLSKHVRDFTEGYRQNLSFIGEEMVGKTSLILHFLNKFNDNRILPIYMPIKKEGTRFFAERFMTCLVYGFLNNSGIELKEDLDYLISNAEKFIPHTVAKIREIRHIIRKNKTSIFLELLSLCDVINKETKKFCLVIFDEFHNLEEIGIKNLYNDWVKVLVLQKNTMFIIISSSKFKAKRILTINLNLLFGKFELIEIEPFDYKTAKEFLLDRLNGLMLENKLIDFLVILTGGIPFYLNVIADSIYKMKDQLYLDRYINKDTIFDILTELLFKETGTLNQRFSNYLNKVSAKDMDKNLLKVILSISNGYNRIKDISQNLHIQRRNILKLIHQLLDIDMITKNGDLFKINDRLFNLWLKLVYQKKLLSPEFNPQIQLQMFRKELENTYNEFLDSSNKSLLERVMEIMYLFEDAYVNIDNKRIDLTVFREIKPFYLESSGINEGLIARSADNLWIVAIKQNPLREEDIEEFSRFCNKHRQKKQKRIVITLHQIDTNVRLKAMEERILTWELKNLNLLCELFNRTVIIG
jgi:hypothetical protein